jgi:chromosome segregation ATPase
VVLKLISWKHSFNELNQEFEMANKKKQALENLLNSGKISQPTYELVNKEIEETIIEVEKQQEALLEKMNSKMAELEGQIKTLEMLLANSEIRHVTGEVDEEVYQRESNLLLMGLNVARQELGSIKDAANQLSTGVQPLANEISKIEAKIVEINESKASQIAENVNISEEKQGT